MEIANTSKAIQQIVLGIISKKTFTK